MYENSQFFFNELEEEKNMDVKQHSLVAVSGKHLKYVSMICLYEQKKIFIPAYHLQHKRHVCWTQLKQQ